jgi:hypothetical protein
MIGLKTCRYYDRLFGLSRVADILVKKREEVPNEKSVYRIGESAVRQESIHRY